MECLKNNYLLKISSTARGFVPSLGSRSIRDSGDYCIGLYEVLDYSPHKDVQHIDRKSSFIIHEAKKHSLDDFFEILRNKIKENCPEAINDYKGLN